MIPRHRWGPEPARGTHPSGKVTGWEECQHCQLQKKSQGRNGTLYRRSLTGATWGATNTPECTGPQDDPAQGVLFS